MTTTAAKAAAPRPGAVKRSRSRRGLTRLAIVVGAVAVALCIAKAGSIKHYLDAEKAYQSAGLILPAGMSHAEVADQACRYIGWGGSDGAALKLSARAGLDFERARKFAETLSAMGYCGSLLKA